MKIMMDVQKINLIPKPEGSSFKIESESCRVFTGTTTAVDRDSFRVQSNVISQYKWETRPYEGRIIACHRDKSFIAYVLNLGKSGSAVRVYNRESKARLTIKNFEGACTDIAWANGSRAILGCVDEKGNLFVYSVSVKDPNRTNDPDNIQINQDIIIRRTDSNPIRLGGYGSHQQTYRITWCPYVPDKTEDWKGSEKEDEELSKMLAIYQGNTVEIVMIDAVLKFMEQTTALRETTFKYLSQSTPHAYTQIQEATDISTACISPDATALALGTYGGSVKFYILENMEEVRCAHEWSPHGDSSPVDTLIFLDNLVHVDKGSQDQFWKFALTTTGGNRELKLWNCEDWTCMSTLNLEPPPSQTERWNLNMSYDFTGHFLCISDIQRKAVYTIELGKCDWNPVGFRTVSDFPLIMPVLNSAVVNMEQGKGNMSSRTVDTVLITTIAVTPKSVVEMMINFPLFDFCYPVNNPNLMGMATASNSIGQNDMGGGMLKGGYMKVGSDDEDEEAEDEGLGWMGAGDNGLSSGIGMMNIEQTTALGGNVVATLPNELIQSVSKTGQELERVVEHLARQEEELKSLQEWHHESNKRLQGISDRLGDAMTGGLKVYETGVRTKIDGELKNFEGRVKTDIRSSVQSQMGEDSKKLESSITERLSGSVERAVSNELGKALRNKATVVAIGRVVSEGVASEIATGCKAEFTNSIVPTFKQSTANLFTQLNQVFQKGIKDYIDKLENDFQHMTKSAGDDMQSMQQMSRETTEMAQLHLQTMSSTLQAQLEQHLGNVSKSLSESVNRNIQTVVQEELSRQLLGKGHASSGPSASAVGMRNDPPPKTATSINPVTTAARRAKVREITRLLNNMDFDAAFQVTLNACDLELLGFLLSKCSPRLLFSQRPFPLAQPVILSLLHQMAASDFAKDTENKALYIYESLNILDDRNREVLAHMPLILKEIKAKIANYKTKFPYSSVKDIPRIEGVIARYESIIVERI